MAVPKRKTSKSKIRSRKRSHKIMIHPSSLCPQCGSPQQLHRVCRSCGYYRGKQRVTVEAE